MPVPAKLGFRKLLLESLARPATKKRRSQTQDARSNSNCILTKATPSTSPAPKESLNEIEIIRRAQTGDPAAFETLYRLHRPRVFAVCLRMVRDPAEAEDLTQEAFLLLLRKIQTFRGESAFSTWLHRLAVNLVLMRFRKKTPPIVSIEMICDPNDESSAPSALEPGTPDLALDGTIDRINIERCVERLPAGFRKVFLLHDVQGYRHREIANLLGRSVGDSKSQLHKARKRLRESLGELQRDKARDMRLSETNCAPTASISSYQA